MTVTLVAPYNPRWPDWFAAIRARIEPQLAGIAHSFEHVGSTAIPGMTAKPVIDIDIVVERGDFAEVKERLAGLGYAHEGDKGLADREAFDLTDAEARAVLPEHHLYVCIAGTAELHKHLIFRDFSAGIPNGSGSYPSTKWSFAGGTPTTGRHISMASLRWSSRLPNWQEQRAEPDA
jgi:GrpB-like predicted nucleotidyltransferase (UPF0157 family)